MVTNCFSTTESISINAVFIMHSWTNFMQLDPL